MKQRWRVPRGCGESTEEEGPRLQRREQALRAPQTQTSGLVSYRKHGLKAGLKEARRQNQERALLDDDRRARCGVRRHMEGQGSSSPGHWQRLVCDVARKEGGGQRAAATMPG